MNVVRRMGTQQKQQQRLKQRGAPGLEDRVFGTCPTDFSDPMIPGYQHPLYAELKNSGIIVAVDECSVTECRRWRPPYLTDKTVHIHANTLQI